MLVATSEALARQLTDVFPVAHEVSLLTNPIELLARRLRRLAAQAQANPAGVGSDVDHLIGASFALLAIDDTGAATLARQRRVGSEPTLVARRPDDAARLKLSSAAPINGISLVSFRGCAG